MVPNVTGDSLCAVLTDHVDAATTHLHTDSSAAYVKIGPKFAGHSFVDHLAGGEYVRGDLSTNQAETYASQLKRSIDGTHHHVSREHVDRYLSEFDFRYSTRRDSDTDRMGRIITQTVGRRLTYRQPRCSS